jgi:hypothetical protein
LCCSWAMYFSAAASSENDQGSMNLDSKTASVPLHDAIAGCDGDRRKQRACRRAGPTFSPPVSSASIWCRAPCLRSRWRQRTSRGASWDAVPHGRSRNQRVGEARGTEGAAVTRSTRVGAPVAFDARVSCKQQKKAGRAGTTWCLWFQGNVHLNTCRRHKSTAKFVRDVWRFHNGLDGALFVRTERGVRSLNNCSNTRWRVAPPAALAPRPGMRNVFGNIRVTRRPFEPLACPSRIADKGWRVAGATRAE